MIDQTEPTKTRKITIDPVTRVEGHGKVTVKLDENNQVSEARLHIIEFRGFERFIQGRPYNEAPTVVQRLCGICPVSHHLAAAKAIDMIYGAGRGGELTPTSEKMRRLCHYGQLFQSHVLHFFHLASPDLLFGVDAPPENRNVFAVARSFPAIAKQAVQMRRFGQEIIRITAGKKVHGKLAVPGGVNKHLTSEDVDLYLNGEDPMNADQMITWAEEAVALFKDYHQKHKSFVDGFAQFPSNHLSIVGGDDALEFYHGQLKAVTPEGKVIFEGVDSTRYFDVIGEYAVPWSYMKMPYFLTLGREKGWYRVGPMARLATASHITSPKAQAAFEEYQAYCGGKPSTSSMHMHWARLIETLHAAEVIKELLLDSDLLDGDRHFANPEPQPEGVGVIEAPRGTLFHHYKVDENNLITMCNLIVSTTSNNQPLNRSVRAVAELTMNGVEKIPESALNQIEVAIRAYDPCLSCATHAVGKMPLQIVLEDNQGRIVDEVFKNS